MACCYSGCSNTRKKNPELTFFRFPKEKYRSYLWVKKCSNANIENLSHYELHYRVVCEEHFSSKCFDVSELTSGKTRRSLFKFAVPEPSAVIKQEKEKNENYRPTALVEPPSLPLKMHQSKGNDLASPSLLMSMAENLCPLMRPISPTPSDLQNESLMTMFNSAPLLPHLPSTTNATFLCVTSEAYKDTTAPPGESEISFENARSNLSLKSNSKSSKHEKSVMKDISSSPPKYHNKSVANSSRAGKYLKILPKSNTIGIVSAEEAASDNNTFKRRINQPKGSKSALESPTIKLNLDNRSLETLPAICSPYSLTELSVANNKIDSLTWSSNLINLNILKLQNNCISDVELLSSLSCLAYLDLSGNKITSLLKYKPNPNCQLGHLDLSNNQLTEIGSLKNLSHLTKLFLNNNKISTMKHWGNLLPVQIKILALANNSILNLQDISEIQQLEHLESFTVVNNPCLNDVIIIDSEQKVLNKPISFNHVPYVLYWCPSLIEIDGNKVTEQDRLKVNWLKKDDKIKISMSEDRGKLLTFLSKACPADAPATESNICDDMPQLSSNIEDLQQCAFDLPNNNNKAVRLQNESHSLRPTESQQGDKSNTDIPKSQRQANKCTKDSVKQSCASSSCKHFIELIEEKARCYKLQRRNEGLVERIQFLESIIDDNQLIINDLEIKVEEDYE